MKRALLITFIVFALVSMSCSLFTPGTSTEAPATAIAVPTQAAPTAIQAQEATPEPTVAAPTEAAPTTPPEPTQPEPTVVPEPQEYQDTFDKNTKDWSDILFVTTQASGRDPYTEVRVENGFMRFSIKDLETYVYRFFRYGLDSDIMISVDYQSKSSINNGIAVVCKANEDMTSWYEVRFTTNNSFLNFYQYDKKRKTEENKNPYIEVGKVHIKADEIFPTKANHLEVTCTDSQIIVDINHGKRVVTQDLETTLAGSFVGLGAMSYDVLPVTIDFDSITVSPAQ